VRTFRLSSQHRETMKHCFLLLALTASVMAADTENWPQYRGANSDGLGEGATLPETWSETENVGIGSVESWNLDTCEILRVWFHVFILRRASSRKPADRMK
jgi:hypothetical protein